MEAYKHGDDKAPGATVQYIDGVRYEGTNQMPLGFRGQLDNPTAMPTHTVDAMVATFKEPTAYHGNTGPGGYTISIIENMDLERQPGSGIDQSNDTQLKVQAGGTTQRVGPVMRLADWQSAWSYLQTNGFKVDGQERALYPREVASVSVAREYVKPDGSDGGNSYWVWNPASSSWVLAADYTR